jgi:hypothetical protein
VNAVELQKERPLLGVAPKVFEKNDLAARSGVDEVTQGYFADAVERLNRKRDKSFYAPTQRPVGLRDDEPLLGVRACA